MIEVVLENRRYRAVLRFHSKFNLLIGGTSTGKSYMASMLARFDVVGDGYAISSSGVHVYTNRVERPEKITKALKSERGAVFIFDEDSDFVSTNDYLRELLDSPNYFIIIGRDNFSRLPYGINSMFELQGDKRRRVQMVPAYATKQYKSAAYDSGSTVVCEGSGLDFAVIKTKYGSRIRQVMSANGKDNLRHLASTLAGNCVMICDWCGTGGATARLALLVSSGRVSTVYSPSFEYELLANQWLCGKEGIIVREMYEANILDFKSEEDFYTKCVDISLHARYGLAYSKTGSSVLAELVCRGTAMVGKNIIKGEPQPVKLDWLYPELKANQVAKTVNKLRLE